MPSGWIACAGAASIEVIDEIVGCFMVKSRHFMQIWVNDNER